MATFLDVSLFGFFSTIFTFILVWVVVYGIMEYRKILGEGKQGLHGLVALAVAVLVLASKFAINFVNFVTPWFLILALVVFFIIFVFRVFGVEMGDITQAGKNAHMWIIVFAIIILLFGFGAVFGQETLQKGTGENQTISNGDDGDGTDNGEESTDTGSYTENVYNTLFHPKVLGLVFLLAIGVIALVFLTTKDK
jgi:hypothetical protein